MSVEVAVFLVSVVVYVAILTFMFFTYKNLKKENKVVFKVLLVLSALLLVAYTVTVFEFLSCFEGVLIA